MILRFSLHMPHFFWAENHVAERYTSFTQFFNASDMIEPATAHCDTGKNLLS
jgi:hypothetical protein